MKIDYQTSPSVPLHSGYRVLVKPFHETAFETKIHGFGFLFIQFIGKNGDYETKFDILDSAIEKLIYYPEYNYKIML